MINLEETFDFYGEEYLPELEEEGFKIDTDLKDEWAVNKILKAREHKDRMVMVAQQEIERFQAIIRREEDKCEKETGNLKFLLQEFFKEQSANGMTKSTKTQESYKLPSAKLKLKYSAPKILHDDAALIAHYVDYVENVPKLKWAELKKTLKIDGDNVIDTVTGEVVEGCAVVNSEEVFDPSVVFRVESCKHESFDLF